MYRFAPDRLSAPPARSLTVDPDNPLVVALDLPDLGDAVALAERLRGEVAALKVGWELFAGHGPAAVERVGAIAPVFLDAKLHDIPATVRRACRLLGRLGPALVTAHVLGGGAMIAAAVDGLGEGAGEAGRPPPRVLAVTLLTSLSPEDLASLGLPSADEQVPRLAALGVEAGAHGVVCAPQDLPAVRAAVGSGPLVVTPGVRPAGSGTDDHARAATPAEALRDGADLLVVGRPVVRAGDPVTAARSIIAEARAAA